MIFALPYFNHPSESQYYPGKIFMEAINPNCNQALELRWMQLVFNLRQKQPHNRMCNRLLYANPTLYLRCSPIGKRNTTIAGSLHANPYGKKMQNIHVIILLQMKNVNCAFFVEFEQKVYFRIQNYL